jgi:hypothetical protein
MPPARKSRLTHQLVARAVVVTTGVSTTGDSRDPRRDGGRTARPRPSRTDCAHDLEGPAASVVCALSCPMRKRGLVNAIASCFIGTSSKAVPSAACVTCASRIGKGEPGDGPCPQAPHDPCVRHPEWRCARATTRRSTPLPPSSETVAVMLALRYRAGLPPSRASRSATGAKIPSANSLYSACTAGSSAAPTWSGCFRTTPPFLSRVTAVKLDCREEWVVSQAALPLERNPWLSPEHARLTRTPPRAARERIQALASPPVLPPLAEAAPAVVGEARPGSECRPLGGT